MSTPDPSQPGHGYPAANPHAPQRDASSPREWHPDTSAPSMWQSTGEESRGRVSLLVRGSIWIAIGALIAAAIVCVVWVLVGPQNDIIGRAFLTILLLAGFAGVTLMDANLARGRAPWLVLASMGSWIVALLIGAVKIWITEPGFATGFLRFFELILAVGILQLAVLHVRLYWKSHLRHVTAFTRTIALITTALLGLLTFLLLFFLTFPRTIDYHEMYWRIVVAVAILAAVGTALVPLLNALFAPKAPQEHPKAPDFRPQVSTQAAPPVANSWPTYVDGMTPLPVMPDGSPDWNAYYTGYPTYAQPALSGAEHWQQQDAQAYASGGSAPAQQPATEYAQQAPQYAPEYPAAPEQPYSQGQGQGGQAPAPAPEQPPAQPEQPPAQPEHGLPDAPPPHPGAVPPRPPMPPLPPV